jgi:hypothetical protein
MGAIDSEEAARRLARVILSDIELYNRERPKQGETLDEQVEEGRRLFASRVAPDLLPIFGLVMADRARSREAAAAAVPAAVPAIAIAAQIIEDQPTPTPTPEPESEPEPEPAPAIAIAAQVVEDQPTPTPMPTPTPAPVLAAAPPEPPIVEQPALDASAPDTLETLPPVAEVPVVAREPEIPAPVLAARISIPKLLAYISVAAATVAILHHFFP